jgi:hemoglobin
MIPTRLSARPLAVAALLVGFAASFPGWAAGGDDALYRDLGGRGRISTLAGKFVDILVADDRIKNQFSNTNLDRLKRLLTEQFCAISGGPVAYTGRDMRTAHAALGITNTDFGALVEDLQVAMDQTDIPFFTQNRLLALLAPMRRDIVTK